MHGLIVGDSFHQNPRTAISRVNGAHRISTVFRKKHVHVDIIDFFNSWTLEELEKYISRYVSLDFLGVSIGLSKPDVRLVDGLISILKKKFPEIKIIAGGGDVLNNYYTNIDLYFKGFAEGTVDDIINYLKTGKFNTFYLQKIKTHDVKSVVDCNEHFKNFDLINLRTEYTDQDFIQPNETLALETSRGCIFKCSFCNFPFTGKKKNEYIREKEDIKSEILENYQKYKTTRYLITDDTFNDNPVKVDMMYEISQELDFELSFMCYARVDLLHASPDQLKKMIDFGVKGMFFGIESLKESTSRKIGKGFSGQRLKDYLLEIRNQYPSLHLTTSFIIGLPGESIEEFKDNIQWMIDNNATDSIPIFPLGIYADNKINYVSDFTKNWENFDYERMTVSEIEEYRKILKMDISDDYMKHFIPWKNDHMNFMKAIMYEKEISKMTSTYISVSGWFGFAHSFNTENLIENLHIKKINYNWNAQIKAADEFVTEYKIKKINNYTK